MIQTIYNKFFNKQNKKMEEKRTDVVLTSYSQDHVLQHRMHEAGLQHGDRVTADLSPVRLESNLGKMIMYFCPMDVLKVTQRLEEGDKRPLPQQAILTNVSIPCMLQPGLYNLKNVQLYSNGTLQVIATADTMFEAV